MGAKSILIGIPSQRQDSKFLASLNNLISQMEGKYKVSLLIEKWKNLEEAQNNIADYFLSRDFQYLLFLDDDHWGHTVEMVDCLINANAEMATIKTYSRHYPFPIALFKRNDHDNFSSRFSPYNGKMYEDVDMTGFPMTLLRKSLFQKLDKPYFRGITYGGRDWNTDIDFCDRLSEIGIKPKGCFQYCLPHGDITEDNVDEIRNKNTFKEKDRIAQYFFNKKGE